MPAPHSNDIRPKLLEDQFVIMDRASFHLSAKIKRLIEEKAQCPLIFLPSYSPDLNKIENLV